MKTILLALLLTSATAHADEWQDIADEHGMTREEVIELRDQLEQLPEYTDGVQQGGYYAPGSTYRAPADQPAPIYYPKGSTYRAAPRPLR